MDYITADNHFGHRGILSLANRPFETVDEMDTHMVKSWNSVVRPSGDTVYHLGDIFWHIDVARKIAPRLNGTIKLLLGNHDWWWDERDILRDISWYKKFEIMPQITRLNFNKTKLWLCHYALRVWEGNFRGAMHCFGHVHATLNADRLPRSLDVGVDSIGYVPLSIEQIWTRLMKDDIMPEELRVSGGLKYTKGGRND